MKNRRAKLVRIEKPYKWCLTIWFWRERTNYGQYHSRSFNINWMKKIWKSNRVPQFWGYNSNGATRKNKDRCFDCIIGLGWLQLNYTNWRLLKTEV